jgi:Spy/CpxP family protein refolding chaperone
MKGLKTLFTAALLLLGVATAQETPASSGPAPTTNAANARMRRGGAIDQLNLTDAQKTQLKSLRDQQHQQLQALRQDQSLTPDQRRAQAQTIHQQFQSQIHGMLTPEQQAQLKQMRGRRGGPMARLNLTDDQRAKLQPLMQQQREQVQAIRNDSSLTQQQKQEKIQALRQSMMSQMQGILTPEQQQQMQQWQQNRRGRHGRGPGAAPQGF